MSNITDSGQFDQVLADFDSLRSEMIVGLLSTVFMAMHTFCAIYAVKTQTRCGLKSARKMLLFATAAMYMATVCSWIIALGSQFETLGSAKTDFLGEDSFSNAWGWTTVQSYVGSGALMLSVIIGDSIVWWRVWVLWNQNTHIFTTSFFVLFATFGLGGASLFGDTYLTGVIGFSVIVLSLFSNIVSTLLIGYKSWKHRIHARNLRLARVSSTTGAQRTLMLLFESGIVYCIIWTLVFSSQIWTLDPNNTTEPSWTNLMKYVIEGCLVSLVGSYPTLIIIIVAIGKSQIEQETIYIVSVGRTTAPLPLSHADVDTHRNETVEGNV